MKKLDEDFQKQMAHVALDGEGWSKIEHSNYAISSKGRVWNLTYDREVRHRANVKWHYPQAMIYIEGENGRVKNKLLNVRTEVGRRFISPTPKDWKNMCIRVKDDTKSDVDYENLIWAYKSNELNRKNSIGYRSGRCKSRFDWQIKKIDPVTDRVIVTYNDWGDVIDDGFRRSLVMRASIMHTLHKNYKWQVIKNK